MIFFSSPLPCPWPLSFAVTFLLYRHPPGLPYISAGGTVYRPAPCLLPVNSHGDFSFLCLRLLSGQEEDRNPGLVAACGADSAHERNLPSLPGVDRGRHPLTPMLAVVGLFAGELVSMLFSLLFILWDYRKYHYQISNIHAPGKDLKDIVSLSLPLTGNRLFINILHSMESVLIPGICGFSAWTAPPHSPSTGC